MPPMMSANKSALNQAFNGFLLRSSLTTGIKRLQPKLFAHSNF